MLVSAEPTIWKPGFCVLADSTTVSGAIKVKGYDVVALQFDAASEGTALTFQGSYDGVTFAAIKDNAGAALGLTKLASTAEVLQFGSKVIQGMHSIKVVFGTAQATADTAFWVGLRAVSESDPT
jgi:hypothetical protein